MNKYIFKGTVNEIALAKRFKTRAWVLKVLSDKNFQAGKPTLFIRLKGVFAKNEKEYRLLILLLSVTSVRGKLLRTTQN